MELEAVGRISVGDHGLEVRGEVDDVDRSEGAFLGADTAADAQSFTYIGYFRLRRNLYRW